MYRFLNVNKIWNWSKTKQEFEKGVSSWYEIFFREEMIRILALSSEVVQYDFQKCLRRFQIRHESDAKIIFCDGHHVSFRFCKSTSRTPNSLKRTLKFILKRRK